MKQTLLSLFLALLPLAANADAVEIDGIYYNLVLKTKMAEVTSNPNSYKGIVEIPDTVTYNNITYNVTSIGDKAFYYCTNLTSVTIPNSVTSIGFQTFYYCSSLTSIDLPDSLTNIGTYAFSRCDGLTNINIPSSVTSIGSYAFCDCTGLTSIDIPNSVTCIELATFQGCSCLKSVTIPNSVTSIGNYAFWFCHCLTSVTIPNSVTSIGMAAFRECSGLTSVTIPNSVTYIGYEAFEDCSSLKEVHITDIEAWCNINFSYNPLFYAHHLFLNNKELTDLVIPNTVTSIGIKAFWGCSGLTSVTIPNSVTSIGGSAFWGCSGLTSVTIPSSVTSIGNQAFSGWLELLDVYCYAENVPNTQAGAFKDSFIEYVTLHVPANSLNAYKTQEPWKNFKDNVPVEDVIIEKCSTPTIAYSNGELSFTCETEGVEFIYDVKVGGTTSGRGNKVKMTTTYTVSVYAIKEGYENSDVATKEIQPTFGDVSGDGKVDAVDIAKLVEIILGMGQE